MLLPALAEFTQRIDAFGYRLSRPGGLMIAQALRDGCNLIQSRFGKFVIALTAAGLRTLLMVVTQVSCTSFSDFDRIVRPVTSDNKVRKRFSPARLSLLSILLRAKGSSLRTLLDRRTRIYSNPMQTISRYRCFEGSLGYYSHDADSTRCPMRFTVFVPPQADKGPVPVLWWLSGLTCTEDNFTVKSGAYRKAAEAGVMIVAPDTSPRGDRVPDDAAYDLGQGAGFYLDATTSPWIDHFNMYCYVSEELPQLVADEFPAAQGAHGIFGHSMGGHGALTIGLKHPRRYASISAFAPIVAPMQCPWGRKAFKPISAAIPWRGAPMMRRS